MITLEEVAARLDAVEARVAALGTNAEGQDRLNSRLFEMLTEVRDDVATLRRHAVATGRKIEELAATQDAMRGEMKVGFARVDADIAGLRRDLPSMIAETMREVLREQRG